MEKGDSFKAWLFVIVLLIFIVGGFVMMKKSASKLNEEPSKNIEEKEEIKDIRLDSTKDYIYYTDSEEKVHELDIIFKNVNLNFNDANGIAKILNDETEQLKKTLTYDEEIADAPYNHLISAKYKVYNTYTFDNYISLVVDYYDYHYESLVSYLTTKTYVFDKITGNLLSNEKLLDAYELTKDDVINKVKTHIADEDIAKEEEDLDEVATVEAMTELSLFVDKIGRLSISVLVKSDQKDYNEIILLD